nr:retrovirus-related Pol polyprotein from transposon TNT 1-94 [Tanacetum cinerariifolium]
MKVKESVNVIFDESPPPTTLPPLVNNDVGEEEVIRNNTKVAHNNNNKEDESIEVDEVVNIKESKNHPLDQDLVPLPMSQFVIERKWVFRNKLDENGIVSRNKARLVTQVYNQQECINYNETYATVARLESIRILLAIAYAIDFKLYQMDVKSAFLNGFINEKVYVAQPSGFIEFQKPNYVYKVEKALYDLKQAPKAWYNRLKAFLIKHEYSMGMVNNTLFTNKSKSHLIIVQIFVNDIIFGSTSQNLWNDFAKIMHNKFEMSMMGRVDFLLGYSNKTNRRQNIFQSIKVYQGDVKEERLEYSKPTKMPMSVEIKLTKDDEADFVDSSKYQVKVDKTLIITIRRARRKKKVQMLTTMVQSNLMMQVILRALSFVPYLPPEVVRPPSFKRMNGTLKGTMWFFHHLRRTSGRRHYEHADLCLSFGMIPFINTLDETVLMTSYMRSLSIEM